MLCELLLLRADATPMMSFFASNTNQLEETAMTTAEWLNKYESVKDKLACKTDLDAHFTEKVIGNMGVQVLDIG